MPDDRRRRARARSARRAGLGQPVGQLERGRDRAAPTASSPPTSARWCASTSRSSSSRTAGARPAASASAGAISTIDLFEPATLEPRDRRGAGAGAGQSRFGRCAGRRDDRAARPRLARRAAARSGRPWARRRFQPQGHLRLFRPDRRARRRAGRDRGRRRLDRRSARLAVDRRRGHADAGERPDRGRHPQGLYAGPAQRAADGRRADRQRPPRKLRACADAAHDQHLHARRQRRSRRAARAA